MIYRSRFQGDGQCAESGLYGTRSSLLATVFVVVAAGLPFLAGCSGDGSDDGPKPTAAAAADAPSGAKESSAPGPDARECVDSTSKNLTTKDLIDLGLASESFRSFTDPVLDAMPPGNYAKYVAAVCPDIPSIVSSEDFSPHGALAKHAVESCMGLNQAMTVDERIQRFVPAFEGEPENIKWIVTDSHALADYFCPSSFRK